MANNYDKTNIATMEMIYGEGYLSAGGDEDVARILDGLDVSGKQVLGEQGYQDCRKWTEIRADALAHGGIGQSQFRAE